MCVVQRLVGRFLDQHEEDSQVWKSFLQDLLRKFCHLSFRGFVFAFCNKKKQVTPSPLIFPSPLVFSSLSILVFPKTFPRSFLLLLFWASFLCGSRSSPFPLRFLSPQTWIEIIDTYSHVFFSKELLERKKEKERVVCCCLLFFFLWEWRFSCLLLLVFVRHSLEIDSIPVQRKSSGRNFVVGLVCTVLRTWIVDWNSWKWFPVDPLPRGNDFPLKILARQIKISIFSI